MSYDLIIRNGTLVTADGLINADLAIADGRIVAIGHDPGGAAEEIDAGGFHVFPGLIDAHVHFNEPGRGHWEGLASGSRALAVGGGTLFFDMPLNSAPPLLDAAQFVAKHTLAAQLSLTDFALWGGLVPGNISALDEMAACGVIGFKAFMANSGIAEFAAADDFTLYEGMQRAAMLGRIVAVHAENDAITAGLAQRALIEGRSGVRDFLAARPVVAELEAIGRAITMAEATRCALHIVHVSSGRGVALVAAARARGVDVSCETCPHYLVLTVEDVELLGAVAKCAPPIRDQAEQEALNSALVSGAIDFVASDHSPSSPELKAGDFFSAWGGIAGCQSTLSLLLTEGYQRRGLPLQRISAVIASAVARRFVLPHKGRIALGCDADLALVDLTAGTTLSTDALHYRHRLSPYTGRHMRGVVRRTIRRGQTIAIDGQPVETAPGHLVRPASA
ncbi:allantoinase AllB [Candidatus Gracilibacteria bacterium]|nr:allantoinase AllB [Candidatus Gracilibacteria bacterium]